MALTLQQRVFQSTLPHRLKCLTLILAWHAHEDGSGIRVRVATLARESSLHRTNVLKHLHELRQLGILEVVQASGGGQHRAVIYRMVADALPTR